MTAVAVGRRPRTSDREAPVALVRSCSGGLPARRCRTPRAACVWATLSRRWTATFRPSPIWPSGWRSTWRSTRTSLPRPGHSQRVSTSPCSRCRCASSSRVDPSWPPRSSRTSVPTAPRSGASCSLSASSSPRRTAAAEAATLTTDRPGPATHPGPERTWGTPRGPLNGLAGGAGAASGPLHPAADRPLSRPPGRSHAASGPRQGRVASLRDRLRRPLTLARAARAGVHAAPEAAGARPAGREHPTPGDSAGIGAWPA